MTTSRAAALLGPEGPLAKTLQGYELREGQLEMAARVEDVLANDGILLCEAGTGTGKTIAYLLPAVLSGRKVVVSTATRALQEQIAKKDVPLLTRALRVKPNIAVMKGLPNYVCRRRLAEFSRGVESLRPQYVRALRVVDEWLPKTLTGDVSEINGLAEDEPLFPHITSSSETRVGPTCPYHEDCFVTRMRRNAERADVVIVNHHLFFADLALRGPHPGHVLPDYEAVVFDEAHQLEDTATTFFGFRVSRARIEALVADTVRALARVDGAGQRGQGLVNAVSRAAEAFWTALSDGLEVADSRTTVERDDWSGPLSEKWLQLDDALETLGVLASNVAAQVRAADEETLDADALDVIERRVKLLRENLAGIVEGVSGHVAWFESDGRNLALSAAPVDLSMMFHTRIFSVIPAVVLTSATLTTAGPSSGESFGFLRSRLGLAATDDDQSAFDLPVTELTVPSPFDFAQNAMLYIPTDLPDPGHPSFLPDVTRRVAELVELTDGGAFLLTTSFRSMKVLHAQLGAALPSRHLLLQGEGPKQALLDSFRCHPGSVLVATMSFWEGVDIPGAALRLVVLEKLPFPVPTDPIVRARSLAIEGAGRNPFMDLLVPAAAISLKQGFGRLIRTRTDHGIVALLDRRVQSRGYGKRILRPLPPARRIHDIAELTTLWQRLSSSGN